MKAHTARTEGVVEVCNRNDHFHYLLHGSSGDSYCRLIIRTADWGDLVIKTQYPCAVTDRVSTLNMVQCKTEKENLKRY